MRIVVFSLFLLFAICHLKAQDSFKGTIFELLNKTESDSIYQKWMSNYIVRQNGGSYSEKILIAAPKGKKNARYNVVLNIFNRHIVAVTVMNFGKKKFYGQYNEALPFGLKWGDDWESIQSKLSISGYKSDRGVTGNHGGWKFLLGFENIIAPKYELTEEGRRLRLTMKDLNRITFNSLTGPEYLNALE